MTENTPLILTLSKSIFLVKNPTVFEVTSGKELFLDLSIQSKHDNGLRYIDWITDPYLDGSKFVRQLHAPSRAFIGVNMDLCKQMPVLVCTLFGIRMFLNKNLGDLIKVNRKDGDYFWCYNKSHRKLLTPVSECGQDECMVASVLCG